MPKDNKSVSILREILFRFRASHLLIFSAIAIILLIFFTFNTLFTKVPSSGFYLFMIMLFFAISFSGGSIMNKNGIDFAYPLFFGIVIVFGFRAGFVISIGAFLLEIYVAKIPTPVDFALEKNLMAVTSQLLTFISGMLVLAPYYFLFGESYIMSNLLIVYMVSYIISRLLRNVVLVMFARVPAIKSAITVLFAIIISYYVAMFMLSPYIAYLKGF